MPKAKALKKDSTKDLILHPNSRKTAKIAKKNIKANAREKSKLLHQMKVKILAEKVLWFKDHLLPDVDKYTAQQTIELLELYLQRFDDELEQISIKHSIGQRKNGRQHANREDVIKLTLSQDQEDFRTCGIECPDVMNAPQLAILRKWNGDPKYIQHFTLRRFSRAGLLQAARSAEFKKIPSQPDKKSKVWPSSSETSATAMEPQKSDECSMETV